MSNLATSGALGSRPKVDAMALDDWEMPDHSREREELVRDTTTAAAEVFDHPVSHSEMNPNPQVFDYPHVSYSEINPNPQVSETACEMIARLRESGISRRTNGEVNRQPTADHDHAQTLVDGFRFLRQANFLTEENRDFLRENDEAIAEENDEAIAEGFRFLRAVRADDLAVFLGGLTSDDHPEIN